jgi:NTE family protein
MTAEPPSHPHRAALLIEQLRGLFPDLGDTTRTFLLEHLQWVEITAGETLIRQGETGDSAYLTISGRLRVYVEGEDGQSRMVRELSRGEVIGEMSLYTGEPRAATVVAVRDSVLVKLAKGHFEAMLLHHPQVSLTFTRQMIRRLQTKHERHRVAAPVTIGLLPISEDVELADFAHALQAQLARFGRACVVDAASLDRTLGIPGITLSDDAEADHRISLALDRLESEHDFVLLLANSTPDGWTRRCIRNSDEMLLIASAAAAPALHPIEQTCLVDRPARSEAAEILILLHPAEQACPRGTRQWLARRPVAGHLHIRPALERDMARLARMLSRNAVGLVLAGGGARGFAHLGIWRALHAAGIEVDVVGGTSIGAAMATLIAADARIEHAIDIARRAFSASPTSDYNMLPLVSLVKGRRVRAAIHRAIDELAGGSIDIEDLWKPFFCVATNYSQAREHDFHGGDLALGLEASMAIPGALPPVVHDGNLLCDGGTFNNFPVDIMRDLRGVGPVIGVDLGVRHAERLDLTEIPGTWELLRDRLRPRRKRRYRLPSLVSYLLNVTVLYSEFRQSDAKRLTDLYFNPPLFEVGMLQWSRFDQIVRQGELHAVEVLGGLSAEQRARFTTVPAGTVPPTGPSR